MSLYHYRAYNASGETITGVLEADSVLTVDSRLRATGQWLIEAKESSEAASTISSDGVNRIKLQRRELIDFFVQMSLLLKAGITLPAALNRLAEDTAGSRMGEVARQLCDQVAVGVPLNQAMMRFPRVFSRQITAMIEAGEVSGKMSEVFESLSKYYDWLEQLSSDIRQALIYPLMVLTAATAFVLLLFTFVVPKFVGLLLELNLKVPLLTRVVMSVSQTLIKGWPVIAAVVVLTPILFRVLMKNPVFARGFDRMLMRLPIFGSLVAMFALSRFAHNLAMLYRSGITLVRGLEICRELVGNRAIAEAVDEVRHGVLEGTPMHKSLSQHDVFPRTLVTMIATGETSGSLDFALDSVADYYNKIIPRRIKIVFSIFDPVMMVSLIAVVGVVALSVVLPILQLWDAK
ncbi:MAG TPA: type II secretion system F family protein [Opitutaceae bacterium]|nr:type II secretion system F family protein [Opitutaceae bacterium]